MEIRSRCSSDSLGRVASMYLISTAGDPSESGWTEVVFPIHVQQWNAHKIPAVNTTMVTRWENAQEAQLHSSDEASMFLEKN